MPGAGARCSESGVGWALGGGMRTEGGEEGLERI